MQACAAPQVHAQLSAKYPGVIVPPLPEKQSATVQTMRVSGVGFSAEWYALTLTLTLTRTLTRTRAPTRTRTLTLTLTRTRTLTLT